MEDNIRKSFQRLSSELYHTRNIFRPADYDWPGDWEGRALLAFCRLYSITGQKIPAMDEMMALLPQRTNAGGWFGSMFEGSAVDEQQLSGHSWYLRGLVAYSELFPQSEAMEYAKRTVYGLFLPALQQYADYPVERSSSKNGGVSGNLQGKIGNWILSTDVGCAFIALDGLAHYYAVTADAALQKPLEDAIEKFMSLDKVGLKMQTHATLTATRGILKYYDATGKALYLTYAREVFDLYTQYGMTDTYENYNWFGRKQEEIWTEPCAVVDSLILALELYRHTGEEKYRKMARRIWFNGLQFCQRENGGTGPNSCVDDIRPHLKRGMYEAFFCCTMRYPEGLYWHGRYRELFDWQSGMPVKEGNCYLVNDWLLAEDISGSFPNEQTWQVDGKTLIRLPSLREIPETATENVLLRVIF